MITKGQQQVMEGGTDRNKERAQEIIDKRKAWHESKTAPTIGTRGKLNSGANPSQASESH